MKYIIYKYVFKNEIIYIGKSDAGLGRLTAHGKKGDNIAEAAWDEINQSDIYISEMANEHMTDIYESEMIRRYKPKYNKAKMKDWGGISLPEPTWSLYRKNGENKTEAKWHSKYDDLWEKYNKLNNEYESLLKIYADTKIKEDFPPHYYSYITDRWGLEEAFRKMIEKPSGSGITYEDIVKEYRENPQVTSCYISTAYDSNGLLNCKKMIYSYHGGLEFLFEQYGTVKVSGGLLSNPKQEHFSNWNVFRPWINRGSNMYYKVDLPKTHIEMMEYSAEIGGYITHTEKKGE